jgi:uncharacterized membrane protein
MIKKYFITGLVILLPIVMTLLIISFLVNILTQPFLGAVQSLLIDLNLPKDILTLISKSIILLFFGVGVLLIGFLGSWVFLHYFFKWFDILIHRIPLVNNIYQSTKDVMHSLFSSDSPSFSQVVLIPFPSSHSLCIGLISKESINIHQENESSQVVSIFVPGTPNPSVGFLLMYRRDQLIFTNLKVDEAMKLVISCGVMLPEFALNPISKRTETPLQVITGK